MKAEMARQQSGGEKGGRDALTATDHHLDARQALLILKRCDPGGSVFSLAGSVRHRRTESSESESSAATANTVASLTSAGDLAALQSCGVPELRRAVSCPTN